MSAVTEHAPRVGATHVTFSLPDPDDALAGVRLLQELERPRNGPPFRRPAGSDDWVLEWPLRDVARFEYLLELEHRDGRYETIPDPGNPLRAPGPFGEKSVVELPGYAPPAWLVDDADVPAGATAATTLPSRALRAELPLVLWAAAGTDPAEPLPLLVVHDGPEYAALSALTTFLDRMVAAGRVPPMRAALLGPAARDDTYSAAAVYARALVRDLIPGLERLVPTPAETRARVGMGASLGALAMLHAHRVRPDTFGGLFLQSGSYFRGLYDRQEAGFSRFRRISRFVGTVLAARDPYVPVPVAMTCGTVEENLRNNLAVRDALEAQGYPVTFQTVRDGHNWVAWRDSFDPGLADLLATVWG